MFKVFYPRKPNTPYPFNPSTYGNKPGYPCPICNETIIHHSSISICQCRIFSHKSCFLQKFPLPLSTPLAPPQLSQSPKQPCINSTKLHNNNLIEKPSQSSSNHPKWDHKYNPQHSKPICIHCNSEIKLIYQQNVQFRPHCKPYLNVTLLMTFLILLPIIIRFLVSSVMNDYQIVIIVLIGYSLVINVVFAIIVLLTVLFQRMFKLIGVNPTDKSLDISAFKDLQMEQNTQQSLFHQQNI